MTIRLLTPMQYGGFDLPSGKAIKLDPAIEGSKVAAGSAVFTTATPDWASDSRLPPVFSPLAPRTVEQVEALPGVDCLAAVNDAIASLQARGGGTLHMPFIGGVGYHVSNRIYIDSSNITILLEDNLTYTGTVGITAVIHFTGAISPARYIENPALIAPKRVRIDANGRNLIDYVHPTPGQPGAMHGVLFQFCKNIYLENIYVYNGASGGITTSFCLGGRLVNPEASDSMYDNGVYIYNNGEHYGLPTDSTPERWANIEVLNPRAWNCANHGLGIYGAINTTWINPKVWNCGNNLLNGPDGNPRAAGPAGGFGIEFDSANDPSALNDYRVSIQNIQVVGSTGYGLRSNCKGVRVVGGYITGTKKPTVFTDSVPPVWGSSVFVQHNATVDLVGVDISGSDLYGVRVAGSATQKPRVRIEGGRITGCLDRALYAINFDEFIVSPTTVVIGNGLIAGGTNSVELNNLPNNSGFGYASISGRFEGNGGQVIVAFGVGTVNLSAIRGHNNGVNLASANHTIYIDTATTTLIAGDILLTSNNGKQARILKTNGTIAKAVICRDTILGDQTSTVAPRADVAATILLADVYSAVAPAAAPSYFGQKWYDTALGKMYFAKGQGSVADWVILN